CWLRLLQRQQQLRRWLQLAIALWPQATPPLTSQDQRNASCGHGLPQTVKPDSQYHGHRNWNPKMPQAWTLPQARLAVWLAQALVSRRKPGSESAPVAKGAGHGPF